jgi:hypothetical protein
MRPLRARSAAAFASAIASRHGTAPGRAPHAAVQLLHPRVPVIRSRVTGSRAIYHRWSVRVSLGLRQVPRRWSEQPPSIRTLLPVRNERRNPGRLTAETLAKRLPLVLGGLSPRATPPMPLVVRRHPASAQTAPQVPSIARSARELPASRTAVLPTILPVGELDRVTDHVLRSLDRRMSSWRERRGKV